MEKTVEELEKNLAEMREHHRAAWDIYGSELCTAGLIAEEEKLEKEIAKLKQREETIKRWEKSGLLEGLTGGVPENPALVFAPNPEQIIKEDPSQVVDN